MIVMNGPLFSLLRDPEFLRGYALLVAQTALVSIIGGSRSRSIRLSQRLAGSIFEGSFTIRNVATVLFPWWADVLG